MILCKTVMHEATAYSEIEKSKFIAYIKPVENKEEADEFVKSIKLKHKDATHNVPAMVIGDKMQVQWASDDGEPQGTAGAPIVQMLVKEGITNVAIVITRYFGGIKLGTGGLVRAYTRAAKLALDEAIVCDVKEMASVTYKIDYKYLQGVQRLCEQENCTIRDIKYEEKIIINILTESENVGSINKHIVEMTSANLEIISQDIEIAKILKKL